MRRSAEAAHAKRFDKNLWSKRRLGRPYLYGTLGVTVLKLFGVRSLERLLGEIG